MKNTVINETFRQLYGQPCWGFRYDGNLNLSMSFGRPSLHVREPYTTKSKSEAIRRLASRRNIRVRGEWWLWIFCSYWRITSGGRILATGSDSRRAIDRAILALEGQKLTSANVNPNTGATCFIFDLGGVLECRRFEKDSDSELWMLYKPTGYVLTINGNGTFSHQRSSKKGETSRSIEPG